MNKNLKMLLVVAFLLPLTSMGKLETLAERKKRIERKYLQKEATLTQGELVASIVTEEENERIAESEQYKNIPNQLEAELGNSSPIARPRVRRPIPVAKESWMFAPVEDASESESESSTVDPTDPFGLYTKKASIFQTGDNSTLNSDQVTRRTFSSQRSLNERSTMRSRSLFNRQQQGQEQQSSSYAARTRYQTGLFGQESEALVNPLEKQDGGSTRYDPTAATQYSPLPTATQATGWSSSTSQAQQQSTQITLRENQYKKKTEQVVAPAYQYQPTETQTVTPNQQYEKWKKRTKGYDPTSDSAYLDQMMR